MKTITIFLALFFIKFWVFAQAPDIEWEQSFLGTGYDIQQTSDGGYITVGFNNPESVVAKLDDAGNTEWTKTFTDKMFQQFTSVKQTTDGGYILSGAEKVDCGVNCLYWDSRIVKLDASGNLEWDKHLGDQNGGAYDDASTILQTSDGGYITAGEGDGKYWVVKMDDSGNIEWENHYVNGNFDMARDIVQTLDGGYIIAGQSDETAWIVKLDASGTVQWDNLYGVAYDIPQSIRQTTDNGYIVAGSTENGGKKDYWIFKLDNTGNMEWDKTMGGSLHDWANEVELTQDGGYIVIGAANSSDGDVSGNHGAFDYWVMKLDNAGNTSWKKAIGGTKNDYGTSVKQTNDGGYILVGYSEMGNNNDFNFRVVKLKPEILGISQPDFDANTMILYPNPAENKVFLKTNGTNSLKTVVIYNALGQQVFMENLNGMSQFNTNLDRYSTGVYFLKAEFENGKTEVKKFLIKR